MKQQTISFNDAVQVIRFIEEFLADYENEEGAWRESVAQSLRNVANALNYADQITIEKDRDND